MKKYQAILKYDGGYFRIIVNAMSINEAIQVICNAEGCPICAIIRITEKK